MSYEDELTRLQSIITADDSTDEQRKAARQAKTKLIDNAIEASFKRIQDRTQEFDALLGQLRGVVDKIAANQLTGVITTLDNIVSDVQKAAAQQGPPTG